MTERKGLVSIIIPAYNAEKYIHATLHSIIAQTYSNWEVVVMNDGSSDRTGELVQSVAHPSISLINQRNAGVSVARNTGFKYCHGEFVCFFDADDLMTPEFLQVRIAELDQNSGIDFVGGMVESFPVKQPLKKAVAEDPMTQIHFFDNTVATIPSNYIFRSSLLKKTAILFNPSLSSSADRFFLLEISRHCRGVSLTEEKGKLLYRISENSMSHHVSPKLILDYSTFYKELERRNLFPEKKRSVIKSMYLFSLGSSFSLIRYWKTSLKHFVLSFFTNPLIFFRQILRKLFKKRTRATDMQAPLQTTSQTICSTPQPISSLGKVSIINPFNEKELFQKDGSMCDEDCNCFPVVDGVPRFVKNDNYTESFGFQWNKFQKTQIDRESKTLSFSKDRFFSVTEWDKQDLNEKNILEAGSGAGRFTQIVLDYTKANLYSFDYSDAVSANFRNNSHHGDRLKLFQASIYEMPFPDNSFDKVFCFGVLQHTPDFRASVQNLVKKVKPGGEIVVDFYPIRGWYSKVNAKYMLRPITKKMSHERLLKIIERNANRLITAYRFFSKIRLGMIVHRFLPICDIDRTLPSNLSKKELREWVILDTFDMFSPTFDNPQRVRTVKKWMEDSGIEVSFAGFKIYSNNLRIAVVKGIKKQA